MLYVACGHCGNTTPLWCAGGFPPHGPMLALQGPSGALCPYCGPMPPAFTCGRCGLYQMMFFPMLPPMYGTSVDAGNRSQPCAGGSGAARNERHPA